MVVAQQSWALPGALTNKMGGLIQGVFPRRCYVILMAVMVVRRVFYQHNRGFEGG